MNGRPGHSRTQARLACHCQPCAGCESCLFVIFVQVVLLLRRAGVLSKIGENNIWDNMADAVENARLSLA